MKLRLWIFAVVSGIGLSTNIYAYSDAERNEIIRSISGGDVENIFRIIDQNPLEQINYPFGRSEGTLLHSVVQSFHTKNEQKIIDLIQKLIDKGIDINRYDNQNKSVVFYLGRNKNTDNILKLLIENGADISLQDHSGKTALHIYTEHRNLKFIRQLVESGAKVDIKDNLGVTPLMIAVKTGQESIVEYLLGSGADINAVDLKGNGLIHIAASIGNMYMLDFLLKKGMPLEQPNKLGETALSILATAKKWAFVRILIERGASTNVPMNLTRSNKESVGLYLLFNPNLGMADLVTKENFNVHQKLTSAYSNSELSLIGRAVSKRKVDALKKLINLGADVNDKGSSSYSPLMLAIQQNPDNIKSIVEIIRLLLEHGADVEQKVSHSGRDSILMWVAQRGYTETVRLLLEYGADATVVLGSLTQSECMRKHNYEIMLMLLRAGMPINYTDSRFWMLLKDLAKKVDDDEKLGIETIKPELFKLFFERRPVVDLAKGKSIKTMIDVMTEIDSVTVLNALSRIVYINEQPSAQDYNIQSNQKILPKVVARVPNRSYSVKAQLHMVGVYEAVKDDDTPWWAKCKSKDPNEMMRCHAKYASNHEEGVVIISIKAKESPIILALMAYEPVNWVIDNTSGVKIEGVILSGYHGQRITGISSQIPIDVFTYEPSSCGACQVGEGSFYAYKQGTTDFTKAYSRLKELTSRDPSTFQGKYKGKKFTVVDR